MQPYGVLFCLGRRTEGVQGGTEGNISPVGCPPKAEMTRSSGKQQAERTAVRAAPIACPEESPLPVSLTDNFVARNSCRGLTRRLRRVRWGCRPEGGSTFFRSERKYQRKPTARRLQRRPAPLCVAGFGLREPYGLSSTSVRCAHPPGKSPLLPILTAGLAMSRAIKLES